MGGAASRRDGEALFPCSPKRMRWVRQLVMFSFLLMTLSSPLVAALLIGSLEFWYHLPQLTPSDRFDVIVVLGGTIDEKGSLRLTTEPSSYSRNRTTCGVNLYRLGYARTLVLTEGDARGFGTGPKKWLK
jgi:hypothetical protein